MKMEVIKEKLLTVSPSKGSLNGKSGKISV